jgi:hypothetical protein
MILDLRGAKIWNSSNVGRNLSKRF